MKTCHAPLTLVAMALVILFATRLPAETASSADTPLVSDEIRQLMQDRDYPGAIEAIDRAAQDEDAPKDYLTYLKGRALFLQEEYDAAVAVFEQLPERFPGSDWTRRAHFATAVALARKGDFRAAELIFRGEAEYLLSSDRKQQIADLYLEFADTYFEPPKEDRKPNYSKALEFYKKALEVGPKPRKRAEVELLIARCHQQLGQHGQAATLLTQFIERHDDSPLPIVSLEIDARFRLGQCRMAEGNPMLARRSWQDLLAEHADSDPHQTDSARIAEATFELSRTWNIPKPDNDEELALGTAALRTFLDRFAEHELAGRAHLDIARSNLHRGRHEDAVTSLKQFLADTRYADLDEIPDARNLLGRSYQLQKKFTEALATWREYLTKHPAHKAWSTAQRQIIDTEYLMATEKLDAAKLDAKEYDAANELFAEFLAKYPLDGRNPNILLLMNRKNTHEKKWDEAIAAWRRLVSKYPGTNEASAAQFSIGDTLERELGNLEEALEEYRKVTWGNSAGGARQAIARLTAKTMTVATERVFRSDETPLLKLTTRNIESLSVRAYKVDMETYFRKMHLARGVEQLDISLIDPDRTFEFEVPDYVEFQETECTIEVPLPDDLKSGVMAVTVSSTTLETTTLVIQSDLDLIVKSSRDEVFVFAQNMLSGKPWADARLLISDGKNVFAEATTGDDGVLQQAYDELKDAADVRVFAIAGGNVASNVVGLQGVGVARGLSDKGYLYTDRPAYRAGELVHVRGCLRHVTDDAYTVEKDKPYTIEVFDGRNRLVRQEEVTLSEFGSFHTHFVLPISAPQGQYRVLARDEDNKTYQGTFRVHQHQLEPIRLIVDTPRNVYYRGEQIEGTIRAEFYYGAPLAGREIRYQLAGGRQHTATTDEKGEVRFKLPTREFRESQILTLAVTLTERNLSTGVNFVLAAQGFSIGVDTVRPVYVAGETFETTIHTNDAEGKPIAKELILKVLEKTIVQGKVGERLVEEHTLRTDKEDGIARQTLMLEAGGNYVVRVEGTDRFDNPISGQYAVKISDEKDTVRLRILADTHTYKVGDTAKIKVHWREQPALALVTLQGARVLDYRLVELKKGPNVLDIPMVARLAPNFELAIAAMTDKRKTTGDDAAPKRFHEASSPFTVERDLRVTIATKRKDDAKGPIRPGEQVEVTVTTTDPQGKPVVAELSLAMVEQSLLGRFPWQVASIRDFFRGTARQSAVRTTSSITFAYNPTTRPINPRLLAERDRLEVEREEEASLSVARTAPARSETSEPGDDPFGSSHDSDYSEVLGEDREILAQAIVSDDTGTWSNNGTVQLGGITRQSNGEMQQLRGFDRGGGMGGMGGGMGGRAFQTNSGLQLTADGRYTRIAGSPFFVNGITVTGGGMLSVDANVGGGFSYAPANAGDLVRRDIRQVLILNGSGSMESFNLPTAAAWNGETSQAIVEQLTKAGAVLLPGLTRQETGYWNPAVTTDKDGKATVTFTMPDRSTAWTLMARGITTETLAGEATDELVVKKDLFGQLKLPLAFTDGDTAQVIASVHNDTIDKGRINVTLKTTIAGHSVEDHKTIDVTARGIHEVVFDVPLNRPEQPEGGRAAEVNVAFELTIAAEAAGDVVRRTILLKPHGMPVFATASGQAASDTTAWIEAPPNMPLEDPTLQILIGPTVEQSLMDIVLGPAPWCQIEANRITTGLDSSVSDLMASLALQKLVGATREAGGPQAAALDGRVRSSLGLLISSQNDDGGWSWTGRGGNSQRFGTSRIVWALSLAKAAGYTVPEDTYNKALGYVRNQVAATPANDYETKAILLHALSAAGQGDFALANRLYRSRPSLSPGALVHLALAFAEMDRDATAAELLDELSKRNLDDTLPSDTRQPRSLPWSQSPAELRALMALAIQKADAKSTDLKELIDWLLAHRTGHRWAPDKATGPAAMALCRWFAESRFNGEHYKLEIYVNDVLAKQLEIEPTAGTQTIDVPTKLLKDGKQRINFQITGRGRYTYQCILAGFVPAEKLRNTTTDWSIERHYQPAPLEVDGREFARGFGVIAGGYSTFRNPLTQLPVGRRGQVELYISRHVSSNTPEGQMRYLVVTEPIPSGTTVIEKSVRGPFDRFEISPGAITFYIGSRRSIGTIHYELYGYLPGKYRAGPTVLRNAHRPEQLMVSASKSLAVLPAGSASVDKYRLTPNELFELGKHYFAKDDMATAAKHLTELFEKWKLDPEPYKQTVTMLLDAHLQLGPAGKVVHYFEIIKEKWPAEEISFDKIVRIGAAYHEMGEYERSYLIFRATVESSFTRESGVAGFLESQGQFARSVAVMGRLLREYPPEAYVAAATYALAQRVYAKAPDAAADEELRRQKINRVDLVRRAWTMLESFLTAYPDDPAADQAAFSGANALLELKAYEEATAACNRYAKRYPDSDLLDSYWYMIGYCHFATGQHKVALEMCRKVAESKRIDKTTGREVESQNKWRAIYILGQVHHSLGEAAEAIDEYRRVEDRFPDAKQSIDYFVRKSIGLPEVSTFKPGEATEVELTFRNIASCDTKVYRIDLMKFSLLRRNLGGITQINLAGIRPYHEATVELGDGKDYRDRTHKLPLPLDEEGAYLVVCRGENLHASGLVLLTPLAVEVQEDVASGRVRTTVKDTTDDRYLRDVHVKVIGNRNDEFVAGETDLRGVFVADGIRGTSTVIAQAEAGRYAFFRGKTPLAVAMPEGNAEPSAPEEDAPAASLDDQLLEGLKGMNERFQTEQVDELQQMYDSKQGGVEVQKAF